MAYSLASYKQENGEYLCDTVEVTEILSKVNSIPERLNLTKATEIFLAVRDMKYEIADLKKQIADLKQDRRDDHTPGYLR